MKLYERIKALRTDNRMTQKELGDILHISTVSIRNWESGAKNPSMDAIIMLARVFNVSTDYLLGVEISNEKDSQLMTQHEKSLLLDYRLLDMYGKKAVDSVCAVEKSRMISIQKKPTASHNTVTHKNPSRYIPRYTTPSAAGFSVPLDGDDFEMILVDDNVPYDADFAVGIQGSSMAPYINDGDTVYVKKDCELQIGDVGIFSVDGAMYCKQYYLDDDGNLILVSANPKLKRSNVFVSADGSESVKCCGKVLLGRSIDLPDYLFE